MKKKIKYLRKVKRCFSEINLYVCSYFKVEWIGEEIFVFANYGNFHNTAWITTEWWLLSGLEGEVGPSGESWSD